MHALLEDYPVITPCPVSWGHMDAFQHVNGLEMNGRVLRVDQARDRSQRPQRGGGGDRW